MAANRRQFLSLLALGIPAGISASGIVSQHAVFPANELQSAAAPVTLADRARVLVVEDEEAERLGLAELLSGWGYDVDTAADGVEGLEKAFRWSPMVIVADVTMPRMGGMELLERLVEHH